MKRLLCTLALTAITLASAQAIEPSTPNVVIILADDYGYGSAGCYGANGDLVQTPNIDRLAKEGRRFTDANTSSSVCSPTRYSLVTGRYCWRTSAKSGVLSTFAPLHIETTRLTIASLLKSHGYHTAAIGKWHLGYGAPNAQPNWRPDFTAELSPGPLDIGFDYHFGVPGNHGDVTGIFVENRFVYGLRDGKIPPGMKLPGPQEDADNFQDDYTKADTESGRQDPIKINAPRRKNDRVMPELTDKVVHWLDEQRPGAPFFLYYTPVAVHNPVTPEADLRGKSKAGTYGDWIAQLDRSVGHVLEALDRLDVAKNTIVIFTADNGGVKEPQKAETPQTIALKAGLAVNGGLRGGKHHIWEGGFKVPFIVRWPGHVQPGTTSSEMVSLADLLATTAAIVGDKLPPAEKAAEDSYNMLPAILGEHTLAPIRPDMIVHSSDGVFAIRRGPWKWIEGIPAEQGVKAAAAKAHADENKPQLYNLKDDPAETKDVSAEHPEVVDELRALLVRYRDGGYSRELPPIVEKKPIVPVVPPPLTGKIILQEPLAKVPGKPWVATPDAWTVQDGAVAAGEKKGQTKGKNGGADLRLPVDFTDGQVQYELCFRGGRSSLRIEVGTEKNSFRIEVSPTALGITKNPTPGKDDIEPLAKRPIELAQNVWYPVQVSMQGQEVTVEVNGIKIKGAHPLIGEKKAALNFLAFGENLGVRNVTVAKP